LEELVDLRSTDEEFKYEPHTINIRSLENRKPDFVNICPNGKIPAITDPYGPGGKPVTVWESGSCLLYLAEKYHELIPMDPIEKTETISWLFWASTGISIQAKAFGFYYKYCSHKVPYALSSHLKECQRQLEVLETQLKKHNKHWIMGGNITNICKFHSIRYYDEFAYYR
jgi:GST-like protein